MAIMTKAALYRRIASMREKYDLTIPFDPCTLAARLCIDVYTRPFESTDIQGMLVRGNRYVRSVIVLNSRLPSRAQRFTLAHELVHYELHGASIHFRCSVRDGSMIEWQANEGAAELLVPYRFFLADLPNTRSFLMHRKPALLHSLPEKYGVSRAVVEGRFRTLAYEIEQKMRQVPIEAVQPLSQAQQQARGITPPQLVAPYRPPAPAPHITISDSEWARFVQNMR